jgi:general stress protein YciG
MVWMRRYFMPAKRDSEQLMSKEAQERLIEGAKKGGEAPKHFTPESKERQREGARKGGESPKHFTSESKERQIEGARRGGKHSHMNDPGRREESTEAL